MGWSHPRIIGSSIRPESAVSSLTLLPREISCSHGAFGGRDRSSRVPMTPPCEVCEELEMILKSSSFDTKSGKVCGWYPILSCLIFSFRIVHLHFIVVLQWSVSGVCVCLSVCVGGGCKGQAERCHKMSKFGHASELRCVLNFRSFGFVQITVSCENTLCPHLMGRLFACPCLIRFDELPPSSFVSGVISAACKNDVCVFMNCTYCSN